MHVAENNFTWYTNSLSHSQYRIARIQLSPIVLPFLSLELFLLSLMFLKLNWAQLKTIHQNGIYWINVKPKSWKNICNRGYPNVLLLLLPSFSQLLFTFIPPGFNVQSFILRFLLPKPRREMPIAFYITLCIAYSRWLPCQWYYHTNHPRVGPKSLIYCPPCSLVSFLLLTPSPGAL